MPPKAKFTKEEIVAAGMEILREQGILAVTAREIGARLNSSARPIFTLFENMNEVLEEIEKSARKIYAEYIHRGLQQELAFRGVGEAYISFAIKEPKLFQLLFMKKLPDDMVLNNILPEIDDNYQAIIDSITNQFPVSYDDAVILYRHLWIYSHGIATLCATSMCSFSAKEISDMLTEVFKALLVERMAGKSK